MATARESILEQLRQHGRMSVRELAVAAGVSPATAHRHLTQLASLGQITRVRGAAQIVHQEHLAPAFEQRLDTAVEAKQAIAQRALQLVPVGGSVFLDSSTTCVYLARAIDRAVKGDITVVTNSPVILAGFASPTARLIGTPGQLDLGLRALGGPWTVEFLEDLNLNVAFISGFGMTDDGRLTTTQRLIVDVLQQVIRRTDAVYVLLDSSKLGRVGLLDIVSTQDVAGVITDNGVEPSERRSLQAHGINVIVAD